ncbi:MAG TPA: hypothetical protein VKA67_09155 [Verrucomicrobiae bacterium]|nr:hypothetical protein [Verrucomicrobiae bacterium]
MSHPLTLGILSDVHYAGAREQAEGDDFEHRNLANPLLKCVARLYRHRLWLRRPLRLNHLLDSCLEALKNADYVVANGDYSCNTHSVGVSDDAACESAKECLNKLRTKFSPNFRATFGDHELGKLSMFGGRGGMRLASFTRACYQLGLQPFWRVELSNYVLLGVTSSLIALPVFERDTLPEEMPEWNKLRKQHLEAIRKTFGNLQDNQRVLLFCHDPTALPFLWQQETIRHKSGQIEQTIIGHLHSPLILWQSRLLAGMPVIRFLGHAVERMSNALHDGKYWKPFKVWLCPSLAGIELLKDGGFLTARLDPEARIPPQFQFHPLPR